MEISAMGSGRLSVKKRIAFSVAILCLFLIALEAGLRIYRLATSPPAVPIEKPLERSLQRSSHDDETPAAPHKRTWVSAPTCVSDPILHHVWVAGLRYVDKHRSVPYTLITNSQRWVEQYEVSIDKPPDTYRIFYVGDSSVQGVVDPQHKMVEIVEKKLNERFADSPVRFEVINTGTSSYSTIIYYLLIKTKLLDYHGDLIVLNVDMTDVANDYLYRRWASLNDNGEVVAIVDAGPAGRTPYIMTPTGISGGAKRRPAYQWLVDHTAIAYYVDRAIFGARKYKTARASVQIDDSSAERKWLDRYPSLVDESANWLAKEWSEAVKENVALSMRTLAGTIDLLKSHGIRVMVTGVPNLPQYRGRWSTRPFDVLKHVAKTTGAAYLDTYGGLRAVCGDGDIGRYYWDNDPTHFNIEGNRAWAKLQLDFLIDRKNDLLPFARVEQRATAKTKE
ncbi:MAG: SGNH/GDSL hydrolase family protein [Planctomycetes bacterium]|nr:SGNH/GDSL hydrolase family protein [Planctomycetota bacterium]